MTISQEPGTANWTKIWQYVPPSPCCLLDAADVYDAIAQVIENFAVGGLSEKRAVGMHTISRKKRRAPLGDMLLYICQ